MTGGEPFIYPDFVNLCKILTKNHKIEIDSNLSITPRAKEFANTIDPNRVSDIYAALHIEERERTKGVEQFIETVLLLKEKNFHVSINYVIHPTLANRYKADFEYFQSRGIKLLPRPFKGIFDGRGYPLSYSPEEKALFASKPKAGTKMAFNFKGVPCYAGRRLIRLEPDGTIFRCSGDRTVLGNVTDSVTLNTGPEPCIVSRCPCFGPDYVVLNKEQESFMLGLRDFVIGKREESFRFFQEVIKINPEASNAHCNLGVIYWDRGDPDMALTSFRKALDVHPGNKIYILNMASLVASVGRNKEALGIVKSFSKHYRDKDIEILANRISNGDKLEYTGEICVDLIPDDTRTDIFKLH